MARTRPLLGSVTTTVPLCGPKAATAASRTIRSSPFKLSPIVGSTGGSGSRPRRRRRGATFFALGFALGCCAEAVATRCLREVCFLVARFLAAGFLSAVVCAHSAGISRIPRTIVKDRIFLKPIVLASTSLFLLQEIRNRQTSLFTILTHLPRRWE